MIELNGIKYDDSHGSPFDRGTADAYYGRRANPHWIKYGNEVSRIDKFHMNEKEIETYYAGYDFATENGDEKDYR